MKEYTLIFNVELLLDYVNESGFWYNVLIKLGVDNELDFYCV